MGFFSPWFFAGLLAVGLPVWIHLLRQHKNVPKFFSSLMFFERRTQSSVKHRRLRHFLLLALRLAMLILIALLFANPYFNRKLDAAGGKRLTIIAVDNSFSMRYGDHLEKAKDEAIRAANSAAIGQVVALGSRVHILTQPTPDKGALAAAIRSITASDAASSYGELARFLRAQPKAAGMPVEAHLFSDMQKTSMPPAFADLRLPEEVRLELHSVADKSDPNWTVENVTAPQRVFNTKKVRVQATVAGYGTQNAERRNVSLWVGGKQIESKTVDVPVGGRARVEFVGLEAAYGWNRCEVRVDGDDRLPSDNTFLFSIERTDPAKVLFIHDTRQTPAYFKTALEASAEGAFEVETISPERVSDLKKYAFVVLASANTPPEGILRDYVTAGGGLLVALTSAASQKVPVSGEKLLESRYAAREGERFQSPAQVDTTHPALQNAGGLEDVKFYQSIRMEPGNARVIAKLSDGTPLLTEKRVGEGRVLVFASTFDNISNDFPLSASFVPFVDNVAHYLEGAESRTSTVAVGSFIELRTAKDRGAAVEVLDPDGKRVLDLEKAATAQNFQPEREGFFDVKPASGKRLLAAVNAERRESDLTALPEETMSLWRGGKGPGGTGGPGDATEAPYSIWKYILLALAAVTLAESIIANRFTSASREPQVERRASSVKPVPEDEARMAILGKQ